jgi:hypothetical protein
VAWQATDLQLEQKDVGRRRLWFYSFELLIRETRGIPVTFDEIETTVYQPGASPWTGRYQGSWKLDAREEFRIPLSSTLFCHPSADSCGGPSVPIPLWQILMRGMDDRGQAVRTVIDLSLPADPPSTLETTTSKSVRAITLDPPRR